MKFRLFALLSACLLLLPLVSCVRRDRLPDRPAFSAGSGLGTETETDSGGAPVLRRSRGSARSAESRYLVLLLDWELKQTVTDSKTAQPTVTVTVTVSLSHYSLQVGARNGGYVSLGASGGLSRLPRFPRVVRNRQSHSLRSANFPCRRNRSRARRSRFPPLGISAAFTTGSPYPRSARRGL